MITTGTEPDWSTGDVVGVIVGVIIAMVIINIIVVFVIRRGTPFVLIHIMYSKIIFKRLEQRRVGGTGEYAQVKKSFSQKRKSRAEGNAVLMTNFTTDKSKTEKSNFG